jgi:glycosyltransferase involved in cell wall biosynthesis
MGLRLAVVARLEDHKLRSKLLPLATLPEVEELALVRRTPLALAGVRSLCPPTGVRQVGPVAEVWRLATLLRLVRGWPRDSSFIVSFFLMPHALHAEIARRLTGIRTIPVALSEEDVTLAISHPLVRRAVRAAHAVGVRGGESKRRLVSAGLPESRIFEPPNVHSLEGYPLPRPEALDLDVLYLGALVPVKQVDLLLRALALVKARRPGLRAAIVGDGELRSSLEAQARDLGLGANLQFAGACAHEDTGSWLQRARLFVMTSKMEGLPMAMIEALSCGVPVVMPAVGDVTTVARHGENAWIVRDGTPESYAEAIATLLADPSARARLASGALEARVRFGAEYSLEAAQRSWRQVFGFSSQPE